MHAVVVVALPFCLVALPFCYERTSSSHHIRGASLAKKANVPLGTLKKSDGFFTQSPDETLDLLRGRPRVCVSPARLVEGGDLAVLSGVPPPAGDRVIVRGVSIGLIQTPHFCSFYMLLRWCSLSTM